MRGAEADVSRDDARCCTPATGFDVMIDREDVEDAARDMNIPE